MNTRREHGQKDGGGSGSANTPLTAEQKVVRIEDWRPHRAPIEPDDETVGPAPGPSAA